MFSRFFVDRPIFANVIAIITMIFGAVALIGLPIEQYPEITPPTVQVRTTYPGASAEDVANTVAAPIELQINGVENMMYMSSTSSSDGSYGLTVTFEIDTDLDDAQVLVQNRVTQAEAQLPEEVRRQGITVRKQSTNIVMVLNLLSPDKRYDGLFLSNYGTLKLRDELSRIYGVGDVRSFGGSDYSMRVWLDPERLKARSLTTQDVVRVLREQNVQVAAGAIGQSPSPDDQQVQLTIRALGRLTSVDQFEQIVVKGGEGTRVTFLKDVGRVELGSQNYDQFALNNGRIASSLAIFQLPGSNALDVADRVVKAMERLKKDFPPGMIYEVSLDTTEFVRESINEVYKTLFEAGALVLVVILLFLQDWRGVLIPATTVPVTLVGAFAAMFVMGFTINLLTLFGLVLAIGTVVDDAIVIVENAVHHIERGLDPRSATIKAMSEVTTPIIGITLVLMAVFVPAVLLGGITGQLYQQFALTIAATAVISAVNALTLKPAQAAAYLRPTRKRKNLFFRAFNKVYGWVEAIYVKIAERLVRFAPVTLVVFLAVAAAAGWLYTSLPTGFLPTEDQGYAVVSAQLPDGSSLQRTRVVVDQISSILQETEGVKSVYAIGGYSRLDGTSASNAATFFIRFKSFADREKTQTDLDKILTSARGRLNTEVMGAKVLVLSPPSIRGLGTTGGFQLQIQDRGAGLGELEKVVQEIVAEANAQSSIRSANATFRGAVPQLYADVNRVKAKTLDIDLNEVFGTMQAFLGSAYVNDFTKFGRPYQVRVQADKSFRRDEQDIKRLEVRNRNGDMVPLGSILDIKKIVGPQVINRYNLYPSALITGEAAPGTSSGEVIKIMEQILADKLRGDTLGYEWTGVSLQEKKVGGETFWVFGLAVLFVYLVLAAQYESWLMPAAVILVVPLGLLGASIAIALRGMDNNVYSQIGIVLIIALASKNAILIVEFARELRKNGRSIRDAAIEASRLRFRPIIMTSFTFILGVMPLVYAHGAGSVSRRALGTAVFGGMIASTILAVFVVPVFFVTFQWLSELRKKPVPPASNPEPSPNGHQHTQEPADQPVLAESSESE